MATSLPWTNCRLQLASDLDEDSDVVGGVVGRLYYTASSHPAVRQSLQTLVPRKLSVAALALQHVVNKRGPDALVGCIPGEGPHRARLQSLSAECHAKGEVLVCSLPAGDVVLVPRQPGTAERDGLCFVAYATNVKAVELCDSLRRGHRVAVVLDIDNTLIDAVPVTVGERDWHRLDWNECVVSTASGSVLHACWCKIPGHPDEEEAPAAAWGATSDDAYAQLPPRTKSCSLAGSSTSSDPTALCEASYLMHWSVGRVDCTFLVRVRRGWAWFRRWLARHGDRFAPFVCSKGKQEYVQLLWHFLDPEGELLPRALWGSRLTSTFPDCVSQALPKTALTALGCAPVLNPHVATQLAAPLVAVDDSHEAYLPEYAMNVLFVEEYRPADDASCADSGSVLRQVAARLERFWGVTCSEEGAGAWQAAQSFAAALLATVCRTPVESPDALVYLQLRCRRQGEALWHQFTVDDVFGGDVFISDRPELMLAGGEDEDEEEEPFPDHDAYRDHPSPADDSSPSRLSASPPAQPRLPLQASKSLPCEGASSWRVSASVHDSRSDVALDDSNERSLALAGGSEDEADASPLPRRPRRGGSFRGLGFVEAF